MTRSFRYLTQHSKSKKYFYKRWIPDRLRADLTPVLNLSGDFFAENLQTHDLGEAQFKWAKVHDRVESLIRQAEDKAKHLAPQPLPVDEIRRIVDRWKQQERRRYAAEIFNQSLDEEGFDALAAKIRHFEREDGEEWLAHDMAETKAIEILSDAGKLVGEGHPALYNVAELVLREWQDVLEEARGWLCGANLFDMPMEVETVTRPRTRVVRPGAASETLIDAFEDYLTEKKFRPFREQQHRRAMRRLLEFVRGDAPIRTITKPDLREVKKHLMKLPADLPNADKLLPLKTIITKYEGQAIKRVTAASWGKHLAALQSFFRWADGQGYISENPVQGLMPDTDTVESQTTRRLPWDSPEIRTFFLAPLFTGCLREGRLSEPGSLLIDDHRFWIPILCYFTGSRQGEVAQLQRRDVGWMDGFAYLDFTPLTDKPDDLPKHVKTDGSQRVVPLRQEVVDLGFIAYVQSLPNHERRIFPKLKASRDGRLAHTYSRRVGYYTRQIGLTDPRKCFHSFRHTFVRKCRKARLPEDLHDYLTGHEGKKFVSRSYGDVDLDTVKQAIDELDFSEFPLEMIRSRSSSP